MRKTSLRVRAFSWLALLALVATGPSLAADERPERPPGDAERKGLTFTISGQVLKAGQPPQGTALVCVFSPDGESVDDADGMSCFPTAPSGAYATGRYPPGSYVAVAFPALFFDDEFLPVVFGAGPCVSLFACDYSLGSLIDLGPDATGIDFDLPRGGFVEGRVVDRDGNRIPALSLILFDTEGEVVDALTETEEDGTYRSVPLDTGTYFAITFSPLTELGSILYDGIFCSAVGCGDEREVTDGTPILVQRGASTTGIDFSYGIVRKPPEVVATPPLTDESAFGSSVVVCGTRTFVGLPGARDGQGRRTGAVQVYAQRGQSFEFVEELFPDEPVEDANFGATLACSGDFLVAGAPGTPAGAKGVPRPAAPAIMFKVTEGGYSQLQSLITQNLGGFGSSIDMQGDQMIVGAPGADGGGAAAIYRFDAAGSQQWQLETMISDPAGQAGDGFGSAVGISRGRAVVGAPNQIGGGITSGVAQLFDATAGTGWTQVGKFTNPNAQGGDAFGSSVAIDGEMMAIGAPGSDLTAPDGGAGYLFAFNGGNATRRATFAPAETGAGDRFGRSIGLSGSRVVAGAPGAAGARGAAYLFGIVGGSSQRLGRLSAVDEAGAAFGSAVAIDGAALAFGAPGASAGGSRRGAAATLVVGDILFGDSFER